MESISLTCINCPVGCALSVEMADGGVIGVAGNLCARGPAYAKAEVANPTRMMTSTVRLRNGAIAQLPVKTAGPVPKGRVADCVRALAGVEVDAPVSLGQVIVGDVCGTGVDVVATRTVDAEGKPWRNM